MANSQNIEQQDGDCQQCGGKGCVACDARKQQPADEPVGWAEHGVINWLADKQFNHTSFLYATPSKREWVGLTDEEIEDEWSKFMSGASDGFVPTFVKAIEAALRSKNT